MREDNIRKLLAHANFQISKFKIIEREINTTNREAVLDTVNLFHTFIDLRTVLEYSSQDIYEYLKKEKIKDGLKLAKPDNYYFPYNRLENNFKRKVTEVFKDIQTYRPEIYKILESIQAFKTNKEWLLFLCKNTNHNKHDDLNVVEKAEGMKMVMGNNGIMEVSNPKEKGEKIKPNVYSNNIIDGIMQNSTIVTENNVVTGLPTNMVVSVEKTKAFKFAEPDYLVIKKLSESYEGISTYIDKLYKIIG